MKQTFIRRSTWFVVLCSLGFTIFATGCQGNDRSPTADEVKAADQKRLQAVDATPGLTDAQKAEAKSRMGGPAYVNPEMKAAMDKARANGANIPQGAGR